MAINLDMLKQFQAAAFGGDVRRCRGLRFNSLTADDTDSNSQ